MFIKHLLGIGLDVQPRMQKSTGDKRNMLIKTEQWYWLMTPGIWDFINS